MPYSINSKCPEPPNPIKQVNREIIPGRAWMSCQGNSLVKALIKVIADADVSVGEAIETLENLVDVLPYYTTFKVDASQQNLWPYR